jgi:hypothetical protein
MRIAGENVMARLLASCLVVFAIPALLPGSDEEDDPSKWTPVKIAGDRSAPEFEDITAWVNSKPLTMKGLKGKVVVVHFMAFG